MKKYYLLYLLLIFCSHLISLEYSKVIKNSRGVSSYKANNFKESQKYFLENVVDNPLEGVLHYNLGNVYYKNGEYEKAKKEYELALNDREFNKVSSTLNNLGNSYFSTNNYKEAELSYKRAILSDSKNINAIKNYELVKKLLENQQQNQQQNRQQNQQQQGENKEQEEKEQQAKEEDKNQGKNQQQKAEDGNQGNKEQQGEPIERKFEKKMAEKVLNEILGKEKIERKNANKKRGKIPLDGKYW